MLLYCWASWRGCRHDLPVWQGIYEETRDKGFVILGIALDIAGEAVVREFIRPAAAGDMPQAIQDIMGWDAELAKRAGVPTYPCLIDCDHVVAELYGVVNVPTAVWIDEAGRIVRPPEPAGVSDGFRTMNTTTFEMPAEAAADNKRRRRIYVDALRDWIAEGREERACALARRGPVADGGPDTERGSRGCPLPGWRASSPVREAGRRPATPRRGGPPPPRELELPPAGNSTLRSGALRLGRGYAGVLAGRDVARRRTLLSANRDEGNAAALPVSARLSDLAKAGPSRLNRCRTVRCALRRRQLKSAVRACLG